ncbi:sulfatase-like hydrolase/transferase [Rubritalea profundi]|uniref:Sulfatase N-terminal domain-containing protein n=1 Tax=Rubritalea profundi TaxID=1658618 RepID=A0A2S7U255_9BACT|nr:hypothetical protein BSZ32_11590 [Rubritalea profundi]
MHLTSSLIKKSPSSFMFSLALTICVAASTSAAKNSQPNIVFILADDMSYDSVSIFNDKIGNMKTPELDTLVRQGMHFTDAHSASAVCTPTRYGLLTGRHCWRTHLKSRCFGLTGCLL